MDKKTAIREAVNWWVNFLTSDNEEQWEIGGTPLARALASIGAPPPVRQENIEKFRALLTDHLSQWLDEKPWDHDRPRWGGYLRIISTDKKSLHDIVHQAGISTMLLPPKVHLEISPDCLRAGSYGQPWREVYPSQPERGFV